MNPPPPHHPTSISPPSKKNPHLFVLKRQPPTIMKQLSSSNLTEICGSSTHRKKNKAVIFNFFFLIIPTPLVSPAPPRIYNAIMYYMSSKYLFSINFIRLEPHLLEFILSSLSYLIFILSNYYGSTLIFELDRTMVALYPWIFAKQA